MHQNVILPHQNAKFARIILTNQLKTIWPSSLGIPSNAVNILYKNNYICYFLKLPKFLSRISFLFFFKATKSLSMWAYTDNVRSLLITVQNIYLIYVLLLIFFLYLFSFFLSEFFICFFGRGHLSQFGILVEGPTPKFLIKRMGYITQLELHIKFHQHHLPPHSPRKNITGSSNLIQGAFRTRWDFQTFTTRSFCSLVQTWTYLYSRGQ